jgi:hypothetical protein
MTGISFTASPSNNDAALPASLMQVKGVEQHMDKTQGITTESKEHDFLA